MSSMDGESPCKTVQNEVDGSKQNSTWPSLSPGYRFCPTDDELVDYYLRSKVNNLPLTWDIPEINIYEHHPKDLAEKFKLWGGEDEWYFYTPRNKKYMKGDRPDRKARGGFWKATSGDQPIMNDRERQVGAKKSLVFYEVKKISVSSEANADKENKEEEYEVEVTKTNWIMHEYKLPNSEQNQARATLEGTTMLDHYILCNIYENDSGDGLQKSIKKNNSGGSLQKRKKKNKSGGATKSAKKAKTRVHDLPGGSSSTGDVYKSTEIGEPSKPMDSDDIKIAHAQDPTACNSNAVYPSGYLGDVVFGRCLQHSSSTMLTSKH